MTDRRDWFKITEHSINRRYIPDDYPFRKVEGKSGFDALEPVYDYSSEQSFEEMTEVDLNRWINEITKSIKKKYDYAQRMKAFVCIHCGKEMSIEHDVCPFCGIGNPLSRDSGMKDE